ncbi:SART-1 family protein DOT2 isoform X2 [Malania oleifera]|uniref:SART-1 family protein DOT2 isoform X2 n=1 Tax=Malania oleifera TaxID=397392 RepID=UPI0025ADF183|nr:SART-1 family protein DOT2 isoform X2 [Malania oleifera]
MDVERSELKHERSMERDCDDSPMTEYRGEVFGILEENGMEKSKESSKHRSKDKKSRREEKDHRSKDRERSKVSDGSKEREKEAKDLEKGQLSSHERRKEDKEDREKDRNKDKVRDRDYERDKHRDKESQKDKDRRDRGKEKDRDRDREKERDSERGRDKERGKEKSRDRDKEKEKEKDRDKDRAKDRERGKEREKHKDREKEKEYEKTTDCVLEREKGKEKIMDKEREVDQDKERSKDRERVSRKGRDEGHDRSKDGGRDEKPKLDSEENRDGAKPWKGYRYDEDIRTIEREHIVEGALRGARTSGTELKERILKMKEERLENKNKSDGGSEVLTWVSRSRKLEEKRNAEKEKALQLSKVFEEQDNIDQEESDDDAAAQHTADLAGVKVLHGLDKVIEGGAVVLTLKDQNILADGDINEEIDMLENVEIGEQKQRDEAYRAAKKKTGISEDKFDNGLTSEKKMLPQYDDPVADEALTLDQRGRFSGEAEKKLEELRKRIQGVSSNSHYEDLNSSGKFSSDYYSHEEMLQFKKPKKKKSLRKKEKLDIDALEAEAISAGLGIGDLGSRNDGKRQAIREEQARSEAERRSNAYQSAYTKAEEASKALRLDQTLTVQSEEDENPVFGNDDEDLYRSLERARKLALKRQNEEEASGPQAVALLASATGTNQTENAQNPASGESHENKVVLTEMEEFVWGLQLDQEAHKPDSEDVFMEEDEVPKASDQKREDEPGGWTEVKDNEKDENPVNEDKEEIVPDETIHEPAVGKGLSGALQLLKERGTLKESVEWGGRNMDKKKSKLVGIYGDGQKEIRIERTDEFGRILTPKEAFRIISHKFHGKGPGKMKQEKRMKQYQEELKLKQMKNSDTPSLSVERMREAQAQLKMPYLVLSGHVKPGQTSDPRSGFATVEKDLPGGLTPMLGDRKVEHFLGIKRKVEPGNMGSSKKPKS